MTLHFWSYCETCGDECVICGVCGNNCCNGGYGKLASGLECTACPSAYEKQDAEYLDRIKEVAAMAASNKSPQAKE